MAWCWCGSNLVPAGGLISSDLVALQRRRQLAQRGVHAFEQLLRRGARACAMRGLQAVLHRQQAVGEGFDRELARLGDLFLGAAAGVLGLGLGAQVGVGHLGVLGLQLGQPGSAGVGRAAPRRARPRPGLADGRRSCMGGRVRCSSWRACPAFERHMGRLPQVSRGDCDGSFARPLGGAGRELTRRSTDALQRCQSASWRRSRLVGRPCSMASAGSAPRRRCSAPLLARGDALGRFLVQRCATGAGPRTSLTPQHDARVRGTRALAQRRSGRRRCTSREALAAWPLTCTRPLPISSAARLRVLKKRAAHSHLSRRTRVASRCHRSSRPDCRASGSRTMASSPTTRPPAVAVVQRDAAAQRAHDLAGRSPGPGPSRCARRRPAKGWNSRWRSSARDARAAVGDGQRRRAARRRATRTASARAGGRVLDGVVQQVARQLAQHPVVGAHRRRLRCRCSKSRSLLGDQRRQVQRHRAHHLGPGRCTGASACWRSCSTLASASIWLASAVARSTVSLISRQRLRGSTSPRSADCTCVFSTASGVRSWCEVSRTKRFWWSSRCASRAHHLVGGVDQRQQLARRVRRRRSASGRLRRAGLQSLAQLAHRPGGALHDDHDDQRRSRATSSGLAPQRVDQDLARQRLRAAPASRPPGSPPCRGRRRWPPAAAAPPRAPARRGSGRRRNRPAPRRRRWSGSLPRQSGRSAKPETISPSRPETR